MCGPGDPRDSRPGGLRYVFTDEFLALQQVDGLGEIGDADVLG